MSTRIAAHKFCSRVVDSPDKQSECESVMMDLFKQEGTESFELPIQELTRITGKTPEQLTEQFKKSCPFCD